MTSFRDRVMPIEEAKTREQLVKAHKEWRASMDKIFIKRQEQITGKKFTGRVSAIGDNEMMRMLDNIGWGARPTDKAK